MKDPVKEQIDKIKSLIENGKIQLKGIDKSRPPLESDEAQFFLHVAEDILRLDQTMPYSDIPVADRLMSRLEEGLKIQFYAPNSSYNPATDKIRLELDEFDEHYASTETGQAVPFTSYRSAVHEMFHFIYDGLGPHKKGADNMLEETLAVKFTDEVMKAYGEPARNIYTTAITSYGKERKQAFAENKEHIGYNPNGYGDVHLPDLLKHNITHEFIMDRYDNIIEDLRRHYGSPNVALRKMGQENMDRSLDVYKEQFEALWNIERKLYGEEKALISLTTMSGYVDMETFLPERKHHISEQEMKIIQDMVEKVPAAQILEDKGEKSIVIHDGPTIKL